MYRSASSQFPARHSSKPRNQSASASLAGSFRALAALRSSWKSVARAVDVRRPAELLAEEPRRAVVERPLGQRPFERDRLFHLRGRDAASGVEVHEAVGRECAAAEGGVADTRGGADGELGVLDAALDRLRSNASVRRGGGGWSPGARRRPQPPTSASR